MDFLSIGLENREFVPRVHSAGMAHVTPLYCTVVLLVIPYGDSRTLVLILRKYYKSKDQMMASDAWFQVKCTGGVLCTHILTHHFKISNPQNRIEMCAKYNEGGLRLS